MAKHMTLDTRKGIAHGLSCGLTFAETAGMFHRAESTIANDLKNPSAHPSRHIEPISLDFPSPTLSPTLGV